VVIAVRHLAGMALLLVCMLPMSACGTSLDPTEDSAVVELQNDLGVGVRIAPCTSSDCRSLAGTVRDQLRPGAGLPVNVSTDGAATYYRVEAPGGSTRCLRLMTHGRPRRSTIPLSSAGDCASSTHGRESVLGAILGWVLFLGIGALGLGTTFVVARGVYLRWRTPPLPDSRAAALAIGLGVVLFCGGWIIYLIYWLGLRTSRLIRGAVNPA
jgi:hypothetical protein